jgi:hypothetical protein
MRNCSISVDSEHKAPTNVWPLRDSVGRQTVTILASCLAVLTSSGFAQDGTGGTAQPTLDPKSTFAKVVANQERMDNDLSIYERRQTVEIHKAEVSSIETKVWRVFPSGPGQTKIALAADGKPLNPETYRADLEKLAKYLAWIAQPGSAEREAYTKSEHKHKERNDLLAATQDAFVFTRLSTEMRGDRKLIKYGLKPNPNFKPTTRNATIFSKVEGTVWVDEQSGEMAKIEGVVTDDISIAMFLAKVYKGSHFMQERYEYFPGIWFPSYEQYDFDGRKFLLPFSIHERTFYSDYKRVGPPGEAIAVVRAEIDKLPAN